MEIKNVEVYGLKESFVRSGYPMQNGDTPDLSDVKLLALSEKTMDRATKLGNSKIGSGHSNFLKGILVQFDLKYPQYFTPQLQRYHWIDIISSQSKMHRLTHNKLNENNCNKWVLSSNMYTMNEMIDLYNDEKTKYPYNFKWLSVETKYDLFMSIVSNLPMGYEMWMGISTNYLQLKTIYNQRNNHKLKDDWGYFCKWIEELPGFERLCLGGE